MCLVLVGVVIDIVTAAPSCRKDVDNSVGGNVVDSILDVVGFGSGDVFQRIKNRK